MLKNMKKKPFLIIGFLLLSVLFPQQSSCDESIISQAVDQKLRHEPDFKDYKMMLAEFSGRKTKPATPLVSTKSDRCQSETLGIQFVCPPDWTIPEEKDGTLFLSSSDGSATMSVAKVDKPFRYLHQLDRAGMQELGHYAEGFVVEETTFAGENAFRVKAFSKTNPSSRLTDYYLLHNGTLYKILFSANPKERWEEHKFLIQELAKGFSF